jgi:hypothetical protein
MNCTDFEQELAERTTGGRTTFSAAAEAHRAACPDCTTQERNERALDRLIAVWRQSLPPVPDPARTVAAVLAERAMVSRQDVAPARAPGAVWSMLAALAVLVCVGLVLSRSGGPDGPRQVAVRPSETVEPLPLSDSVATMWGGMQSQSQQAATGTVRQLEQWTQLTPREPAIPAAVPAPAAPPADSLWRGWGEPLGRQVGQAFRFLSDALPEDPAASAG